MILITSSGEFSFFSLFSILLSIFFFLVSFHFKKKKKVGLFLCCLVFALFLLQKCIFGLNCDHMEPPHEEQHCQYQVERSPNAYKSMRDYRNPPWMSAPFYNVPPTNTPYGSTYNPSWGNHPNSSWELRHPQYAPPASPYYASTPQPLQPPQLTSSAEQAILNLSKLVDTFI